MLNTSLKSEFEMQTAILLSRASLVLWSVAITKRVAVNTIRWRTVFSERTNGQVVNGGA